MNSNTPLLSARQGCSKLPVRERHRHTKEGWEEHKNSIKQLYISEDKSLEETMRFMREHHAFQSSARQYKNKLKEWGFEKYIKASVMNSLLSKAGKRKFVEDKETRFRYKGKDILPSRMDHFSKRSFMKNGKRVSPNASTPSFASYWTSSSSRTSISDVMCRLAVNNVSTISLSSSIASARRRSQELRRSLSDAVVRTRVALGRLSPRSSCQRLDSLNVEAEATFLDLMDLDEKFEKAILMVKRCDWAAAEPMLYECLRGYELLRAPDSHRILHARYKLAYGYFHQGRYEEASASFENILDTCRKYRLYSVSWISFRPLEYLTKTHAVQGRLDEVEQKLLQDQAKSAADTEHAIFHRSLHLTLIHVYQDRVQSVLPEVKYLVRQCRELYGTLSGMNFEISLLCAWTYALSGDFAASAKLRREVLYDLARSQFEKLRDVDILTDLSSNAYHQGNYRKCKEYSKLAISALNNPDLTQRRNLKRLVLAQFLLAVALDHEGNDAAAEQLFAQVIARHDALQALDQDASMRIVMNLQFHYNDRPRRITTIEPALEELLITLEQTFESTNVISYWTVDVGIELADYYSRKGFYDRADFLFNQARTLLGPNTNSPRGDYLYMMMMARHSRRLKRWKDVQSSLCRAVALAKKIYGPEHQYTQEQLDKMKAFRREMDRMGVVHSLSAPSLLTLSSLHSMRSVDSEEEPDEMEFLETGMFWRPPKGLLEYEYA